MAANQYHVLSFLPATRGWEMSSALEAMAQRLVRSGKLRINADTERNFVRHGTTDADATFTARELTDPSLRQKTLQKLSKHVAPAEGPQGFEDLIARLMTELKKARGVSEEKELMVARVLVQSAHPSVIELLLKTGAEIYVSYSHSVGDLMAVHDWESLGQNSGLQATEREGAAVFVSAGGDPFFEGEHKHYVTDGFPALARMVIIAGQELGHFADLKRDRQGAVVGRHSVDAHHRQLRANPQAAEGRLADQRRIEELAQQTMRAGLAGLRKAERGVAFYHARLRFTPPWILYQLLRLVMWSLFVLRAKQRKIYLPLRTLPYHRLGEALELYLTDMAFNLAPDADVYRDPDPLVEEAIAVIEAVARVPQQVHKWGHDAVQFGWPNLYRFYYGTVIPAVMEFTSEADRSNNINIIQSLIIGVRRLISPRPGYYPEPLSKTKKS